MNKLILTLLFILIFTVPIYAVSGHVSLNYETMNSGGEGEIYLYQKFKDFTVGGRMKTNLMGFSLKDGYFPAGVPASQTYDLILKYKLTEYLEINLTEGCNHYFSQSEKSWREDETYIKIGVKYTFGDK